MASMPRSLTPLLLLLLTFPAALAIRGGSSSLTKVCDGTDHLKECVDALNTNADGESPRRLAELAYMYLVKDGEALYKETQAAMTAAATMKEESLSCAKMVNASMKYYYDSVVRFAPEESKERFDQAKSNLDELLSYPSSLGALTCPDVPVVAKVSYYEDLQKVTLGLMNSADVPPPDPKKKEEAAAAKSAKGPVP